MTTLLYIQLRGYTVCKIKIQKYSIVGYPVPQKYSGKE